MARDGDSWDATKNEVREMNFASAQTSQQHVNQLRGTVNAESMANSPEIVVVSIPDVSLIRPIDASAAPERDPAPTRAPRDNRVMRADLSTDSGSPNSTGVHPIISSGNAPTASLHSANSVEITPSSTAKPAIEPGTAPSTSPRSGPDAWWYSVENLANDRPIVELSRRILVQFPSIAPATLMVSSADPELSTNRSTARIAACVARLTGCRVLLVDANWETNIGPVKQSGGAVMGLAEIIAENRSWKDLVIETQESHLFVLPCGITDVPMRRIAGETLLALNAEWQRDYTYVFINAGSVKQLVTRRFAVCCDGTYILVGLNQTTKRDAQAAMKLLAECHARVLGAIVFDAPPKN